MFAVGVGKARKESTLLVPLKIVFHSKAGSIDHLLDIFYRTPEINPIEKIKFCKKTEPYIVLQHFVA